MKQAFCWVLTHCAFLTMANLQWSLPICDEGKNMPGISVCLLWGLLSCSVCFHEKTNNIKQTTHSYGLKDSWKFGINFSLKFLVKTSGEQLVCLSLFLFEQNIFGLWVFFQSMPMTDSTILATPSWTWWNWASYMKAGDVTILLVSSMHTCKINRKCLLKTKLPMKRHLVRGDNVKNSLMNSLFRMKHKTHTYL